MRVTRAAQRAQQDVEDEADERVLKDIEPNAPLPEQIEEDLPAKTPAKTPAKKAKGKGKKGAKGKKGKVEEEESAQIVEEAEQPVIELADQDPVEEPKEAEIDNDEQSKVPSTPAVRLTRRQLAKLEEDEALSKSQRAPSPQPQEHVAEVKTEEPIVPVAEEPTDDLTKVPSPEKNETPIVHDEPLEAEPKPTKKPARRTRRQQPKAEDEKTIEDTADEAGEQQTKELSTAAEQEDVAQGTQTTTGQEESTPTEPESAPKPKRLTRRQQAKLEEEQKQAQAEQQTPAPGATKEGALEEIVAEAQAEVAAEQAVEASEETAKEEADPITDHVAPEVVADVQSISQDNAVQDSHKDNTEATTPAVCEAVESVPGGIKVEEASIEMMEEAPATPTDAEFEADPFVQSDEVVPSVEISVEAEPKMLSAEKPFDEPVSTPVKNPLRVTSRSPSKSPMRLEESISAIDRLEEDLESIGKAIPDFDHSDDERSPKKTPTPKHTATTSVRGKTQSKTPAKTATRTPAKVAGRTPSKTPAKPPVAAKAPVASRAPAAAKTAVPARVSKVPSAAAPKSVKPTVTSLARASSVRAAPSKDVRKLSTETADYLASKRRPISLSFPTPPPPPKGRAPTKPTFQLSSDNVAAKLKAQKEERLKREAEGLAPPKQRPISMPPPPKSSKPPTVPTFQLSSEATAAKLKAQKEERLKRMEEVGRADKPTTRPISMPPPPLKSTKPVTKPSFQLPGEATAARLKAQKEERLKRMEEAEAAKKAALAALTRKPIAHRPRQSLLVKDAPGVSIPPPPKVDAPQRSTSLASKRSSFIEPSASRSTSTSSANRNSVMLAEGGKSTVTPVDAAALKVKGKQVFNRDRMEKEAMERERREKEEAAKKARAEAAERGRIASREWAERQKKKKMMMTDQQV